jgi:hypothetical protein
VNQGLESLRDEVAAQLTALFPHEGWHAGVGPSSADASVSAVHVTAPRKAEELGPLLADARIEWRFGTVRGWKTGSRARPEP